MDVEPRPVSDTKLRSITKTISWRLTGTLCTFIVSWLILGDLTTSGAIAIIQRTFNTDIHERLWNFVKWAKYTDKIKYLICWRAIFSKETQKTIFKDNPLLIIQE